MDPDLREKYAVVVVRILPTPLNSLLSEEKRGTQEVGLIALCVARLFQREPVS